MNSVLPYLKAVLPKNNLAFSARGGTTGRITGTTEVILKEIQVIFFLI